ncbi:DMT family transporter [Paraburkholderia diazotrophica]|uniref:Threonine/homoserine efflux transporter RhtA n=1 Tax=Paraburkholderia diazotrophica TaxID=667676 RepID=A0A1H6VXN6_9BURK|nr:DMT family transporter [Paraburkholderia diazotrophica]SEJ09441.1 Threonine/homoserine efflux transporter RhtA [Paraburkholderia diazotrophica]
MRMRIALLTIVAMFAFAGNSLLCRVALKGTSIDPATFTTMRVVSAALALWIILRMRRVSRPVGGNWVSAFALIAYAVAFSFAYVSLAAGTGALLLFGAVQATMIGYGLARGERLRPHQWIGIACALAGLVGLVLPGLSAPAPFASLLMLCAGVAWGVYSLRGKGAADPIATTAGNFIRAVPFAVAVSAGAFAHMSIDAMGLLFAALSGALTSGLGYVIWYAALKELRAATAATVQLSVPPIAAIGGIALLGEPLNARLALSSIAILGGIALVVARR